MKNRNLRSSFSHATNGIVQAFRTERNIKLHCMFATLASLAGVLLKISYMEWLVLILTIGFVIVTELLNTAIEYTVDMVCGKTYNELAKYSKDIAAGATLVAAGIAAIIGGFIFIPKLLSMLLDMTL
jgi:diacylglycerol kinase